jgi:hypothetical protein
MNNSLKYPDKAGAKGTPSQQPGHIDLSSLFNIATQALTANQTSLNQADTYNQNHGDNMVQAFNMITQALASQRGAPPAQQLQHASQVLSQQQGASGSTRAYAQGLSQAAQQFQGQQAVTPDNAMQLIQSLFGGGQQQQGASQGADLLGSLLGGGQQQQAAPQGADLLGSLFGSTQQQQAAPQGADLLGSLLGGGQAPAQGGNQQGAGIDAGDLLNAGMTFLNAKQQGESTLQAAMSALISSGPMGQSPHRQQSSQLVVNSLLQAIGGMVKPGQ